MLSVIGAACFLGAIGCIFWGVHKWASESRVCWGAFALSIILVGAFVYTVVVHRGHRSDLVVACEARCMALEYDAAKVDWRTKVCECSHFEEGTISLDDLNVR